MQNEFEPQVYDRKCVSETIPTHNDVVVTKNSLDSYNNKGDSTIVRIRFAHFTKSCRYLLSSHDRMRSVKELLSATLGNNGKEEQSVFIDFCMF